MYMHEQTLSVGLFSSEMTLSEFVYCVTNVFKINMHIGSLYFYVCSFEENTASFSYFRPTRTQICGLWLFLKDKKFWKNGDYNKLLMVVPKKDFTDYFEKWKGHLNEYVRSKRECIKRIALLCVHHILANIK